MSDLQAPLDERADPVGGIFVSTGENVDRWERREVGWRVVGRDAIWLLHAGDPAVLAAEIGGLR